MSVQEFARLFRLERRRFARVCPLAARTSLELLDTYATTPRGGLRDVAYVARSRGRCRMVFVRRALAFSRSRLVALLRHEFGHVCDPTPNRPGCERRADAIARAVGGRPIRYDASDVQNLTRGRARRPPYLHQ